jgi:hypothetical protein
VKDVEAAVRAALAAEPAVTGVDLSGSRSRGEAMAFSDWDFGIRTSDFSRVAERLPALTTPMAPLGSLWDPLSETWCYMLMLAGPTKVDLIFDEPHDAQQPWVVSPETHAAIDLHFWDWIWWLSTKDQRGRTELVRSELEKLLWFLLRPLGVEELPETIAAAVHLYDSTRTAPAGEMEAEVRSGLRRLGYDV